MQGTIVDNAPTPMKGPVADRDRIDRSGLRLRGFPIVGWTERRRLGRPLAEGGKIDTGQALTEFALVAPILALLLLAIFQFGYVLQTQIGLTNAVREAARRAATVTSPTITWVGTQLSGDGTPANPGLLPTNVQGYDAARHTSSIVFCSYADAGSTSYRVTVTVTYRHPVFFPMLGFATDALDGTSDGNWTLAASAQMRLENGDSPDDTGACP